MDGFTMGTDNTHQPKLNECKVLFSDVDSLGKLEDTEIVEKIVFYLHYTWSAVRVETFKLLSLSTLNRLRPSVLEALYFVLTELCSSPDSKWQEQHGSVLGLTQLVQVLEQPAQLEGIETTCFRLIGHIRPPIREAAQKCLLFLQKKADDGINFMLKFVAAIDRILSSEHRYSESSSLSLETLLGCLLNNIQKFTTSIKTYCLDSYFKQKADEEEDGDGDTDAVRSSLIRSVKESMSHPASSVRQRGGQVFSCLVRSFIYVESATHCCSDEGSSSSSTSSNLSDSVSGSGSGSTIDKELLFCDYMISKVLVQSLYIRDQDSWHCQEISLIIADELLRDIVRRYLDTDSFNSNSSSSSSSNKSSSDKTTNSHSGSRMTYVSCAINMIKALRIHLGYMLYHAEFEIRRAAVQLLPCLARAAVLLGTADSAAVNTSNHGVSFEDTAATAAAAAASNGGGNIDFNYNFLLGPVSNTSHHHHHHHHQTMFQQEPMSFQDLNAEFCVNIVWMAEVLKENQHLLENFADFDAKGQQHILLVSETAGSSQANRERSNSNSNSDANMNSKARGGDTINRTNLGSSGRCDTAVAGNSSSSTSQVLHRWCLDLPARLAEAESRASYHSTLKALALTAAAASSVSSDGGNEDGESSAFTLVKILFETLTVNCKTIMRDIDRLLTHFESLLVLAGDGGDGDGTIRRIGRYDPSGGVNGDSAAGYALSGSDAVLQQMSSGCVGGGGRREREEREGREGRERNRGGGRHPGLSLDTVYNYRAGGEDVYEMNAAPPVCMSVDLLLWYILVHSYLHTVPLRFNSTAAPAPAKNDTIDEKSEEKAPKALVLFNCSKTTELKDRLVQRFDALFIEWTRQLAKVQVSGGGYEQHPHSVSAAAANKDKSSRSDTGKYKFALPISPPPSLCSRSTSVSSNASALSPVAASTTSAALQHSTQQRMQCSTLVLRLLNCSAFNDAAAAAVSYAVSDAQAAAPVSVKLNYDGTGTGRSTKDGSTTTTTGASVYKLVPQEDGVVTTFTCECLMSSNSATTGTNTSDTADTSRPMTTAAATTASTITTDTSCMGSKDNALIVSHELHFNYTLTDPATDAASQLKQANPVLLTVGALESGDSTACSSKEASPVQQLTRMSQLTLNASVLGEATSGDGGAASPFTPNHKRAVAVAALRGEECMAEASNNSVVSGGGGGGGGSGGSGHTSPIPKRPSLPPSIHSANNVHSAAISSSGRFALSTPRLSSVKTGGGRTEEERKRGGGRGDGEGGGGASWNTVTTGDDEIGVNAAITSTEGGLASLQLMDRWLCESITPVLSCMHHGSFSPLQGLCLATVVSEWILCTIFDPLWFSHKSSTKRLLFEALYSLLSFQTESREGESTLTALSPNSRNTDTNTTSVHVSSEDAAIRIPFLVVILRALGEALAIQGKNNTQQLELKFVAHLLKCARTGLDLLVQYHNSLIVEDTEGNSPLFEYENTLHVSMCLFSGALEYYKSVYGTAPPCTGATTSSLLQPSFPNNNNNNNNNNCFPPAPPPPTDNVISATSSALSTGRSDAAAVADHPLEEEEEEEDEDEDEFSDWDESESEDENRGELAISAAVHGSVAHTLLNHGSLTESLVGSMCADGEHLLANLQVLLYGEK